MGDMIDHLTNMPLCQGLPTLMGQLVSYFPPRKKYVSLPPGEKSLSQPEKWENHNFKLRWKSQRIKIHRLGYGFSIDL
jgi:hypothetical protein